MDVDNANPTVHAPLDLDRLKAERDKARGESGRDPIDVRFDLVCQATPGSFLLSPFSFFFSACFALTALLVLGSGGL